MSSEFEQNLEKYAEVILKVGLNLQPKQRLLIGGPSTFSDGIPFEAAPLVRIIAKKAYQMGARLVDVIWADEQMRLIRLQYSPKKSLREYPEWRIDARFDISKAGDANLLIVSPNPDSLKDVDLSVILKYTLFMLKHLKPVSKLVREYALNWLVISTPNKAWADKILPHIPSNERIQKLWDIIFEICRITEENPISAWENHIENLKKRCSYLNQKQYRALKLTSPESSLIVGLPKDHIWHGGSVTSQNGIDFTPNLPTEEIFTLPDRDRVDGFVKTTRPILIQGQIIEDCTFKFSKGRIIEANAKVGYEVIEKLINIDKGARGLGEIALVPHSSPISKTGLLFYNLLIDENASNHIALGQAYRNSLKNGITLSDEEFTAAGGNNSSIHIDLMVGSGEMDVDGILEDETTEAIMRNGEWVFEV